MTRQSKQGERRARSHKKHKPPVPKTGPKKDNLPSGYREHANSLSGDFAKMAFIPQIK